MIYATDGLDGPVWSVHCKHCMAILPLADGSDVAADLVRTEHEKTCSTILRRNLKLERLAAEYVSAWFANGRFFPLQTTSLSFDELETLELAREIVACEALEHVWVTKDLERLYVTEMDHRHVCNALAKIIRDPDAFKAGFKDGASLQDWVERLRHELHRRLDTYLYEMTTKKGDADRDRWIESFGKDLKNAMNHARFHRAWNVFSGLR